MFLFTLTLSSVPSGPTVTLTTWTLSYSYGEVRQNYKFKGLYLKFQIWNIMPGIKYFYEIVYFFRKIENKLQKPKFLFLRKNPRFFFDKITPKGDLLDCWRRILLQSSDCAFYTKGQYFLFRFYCFKNVVTLYTS